MKASEITLSTMLRERLINRTNLKSLLEHKKLLGIKRNLEGDFGGMMVSFLAKGDILEEHIVSVFRSLFFFSLLGGGSLALSLGLVRFSRLFFFVFFFLIRFSSRFLISFVTLLGTS